MPAKKYRVKLTEDERKDLKGLLNKGRIAARKQTHARIMNLAKPQQKKIKKWRKP